MTINWGTIFVSFVLNGVVVAVIASYLQRANQRDLTGLQTKQAKEIAELQALLDRASNEHEARFALLHLRRAEAIFDFYHRLVKARMVLDGSVIPVPQVVGYERTHEERWAPARAAVREVKEFYVPNKLLFDPAQTVLMDLIIAILVKVDLWADWKESPYWDEAGSEEEKQDDQERKRQKWNSAVNDLSEAIPPLLTRLETSFRRILGYELE